MPSSFIRGSVPTLMLYREWSGSGRRDVKMVPCIYMHLTPGVVRNFSKAVCVYYLCKEQRATPEILVSRLNNIMVGYSTTSGLCGRTAKLNTNRQC